MDNQHGNLPSLEQVIEPLAYTLGALYGDGSVKSYSVKCSDGILRSTHTVRIANMDRVCIERVTGEINRFCESSYDIKPFTNSNGTEMHLLAINNELVYTFFYYFIREKLFIADEIFRMSRSARLDFVAGLFDTDGSIAQSSGYFRLSFASRMSSFVEDVARLLQKLGVKVGKIHEQVSGYGTRMYVIKPNIRSFIEAGCYFYIHRKVNRLYKYLETVQRQAP